jgi:flagellar motor switch protein FliM
VPSITTGRAALRRSARTAGRRLAEAVAGALAPLVAHPVRVAAAVRSVPFAPSVGAARLGLAFADLSDPGLVEVDARLASRVVDLLAGGAGDAPPASTLTPVESAALELLLLVALDAVSGTAPALGPRLLRAAPAPPPGALAIDLELCIGPVRGRARLALPPGLVAALAEVEVSPATEGEAHAAAAVDSIALPVAIRRFVATLAAEDLAALAPGDVVLVEPSSDALVLPGGIMLVGAIGDDHFRVEGSRTDEWTGALPIALSVEVARVPVALAELARLEPGALLPLRLPPEGDVVLRAGERAIARGRLVEVEGARGVRVDALEPPE